MEEGMSLRGIYEALAEVDLALAEMIRQNSDFASIYIEGMAEPEGSCITLPHEPTAEERALAKR